MLNVERYHAAAVVLAGKIYVVGGRDNDDLSIRSERYDPESNRWTAVAELNEATP